MPFVKVNIQEEINKLKEESPEFRKAWDEKEQEKRYINNMCELLMEDYGISRDTAMAAINHSGLLESLKISPELTAHIPDEAWAKTIWEGYMK